MEFCERLWSALDAHFDDIEDVRNVADHGCEGGVNGFIYHHELQDFYFKHEDDIETLLDDHGVTYEDIHPQEDPMTVRSCIQYSVWYAVQVYCEDRLMTSDDEPIKLYADYSKDEAAALTKQGFEVVNATV